MLEKSMQLLAVRSGLVWVDATAGGGGHLTEILRRTNNSGTVIGIDRDPTAIGALKAKLGQTAKLVQANYSQIESILEGLGIEKVDGGIIADLGMSSMQIEEAVRGFSFLNDGPLDMRMDPTTKITAAELVNTLPERQLADIIYQYGEERLSRQIASAIVESRPISSTAHLSSIISQCVRRRSRSSYSLHDRLHPATRTFQALRIAVNDELGSLEKFLLSAIKILSTGGRIVVITFHSLEDRLVKQIFRQAAQDCICPPRQPVCTCLKRPELLIITKKPVTPDDIEVLANPRSRSAKLRCGEKVAQEYICRQSYLPSTIKPKS
ncbi:MAG: 16S rRNA (cytosine(1402)-N(4))-methyltransferase RsmH [Candidatus Melainabacteria bacterium]|nr:16S rRNA (cytosine(1402)-N(4))-methyltransferase RsmH [Candidatus Melainabacteria bacterium]